jgi:hypothetical protein
MIADETLHPRHLDIAVAGNDCMRQLDQLAKRNTLLHRLPPIALPDRTFALVLARDDHRYASRLCHGGADRPEQAAMLSGSTVASDHHHLGLFGQIDKGRHGSPK